MKECNECHINQPLDNFYNYTYRWNTCKSCVSLQKRKPCTRDGVKSYRDYLKEAGMEDYYKRAIKYNL